VSDREFNNYLTLLAGLLRLGDKQRRAIAEELRTHLEDRLEELLARGVPREEAIQKALAEFGDAAGLAAQFTSISRGRRRRWLMRVTTFSVAAMVLIAAGFAIFWPGRNAGPGLAEAVAQAPADQNQKSAGVVTEDRSLEATLNKRIDAEFVETPLKDALVYLRDQANMPIYVKGKKVEEAGINLDQPITVNLKQVRLSTFLELKLEEIGLVFFEKDGLLVITSREDAESTLEIRVYDCRDLLAMPEPGGRLRDVGSAPHVSPTLPTRGTTPVPSLPGGSPYPPNPPPAPPSTIPVSPLPGNSTPARVPRPADAAPALPNSVLPQFAPADVVAQQGGFGGGDFGGGGFGGQAPAKPLTEHEQRAQRLIDLIMTNVDPDSWTDMGGAGSISEYHGLIVVTQTAQTHKKVEHVLNMLRQAAGLESPQGNVVR
jgi:hypothetical protein